MSGAAADRVARMPVNCQMFNRRVAHRDVDQHFAVLPSTPDVRRYDVLLQRTLAKKTVAMESPANLACDRTGSERRLSRGDRRDRDDDDDDVFPPMCVPSNSL